MQAREFDDNNGVEMNALNTTQKKLDFFVSTWKRLFVNTNDEPAEKVVEDCFTDNYQFTVNGAELDFDKMIDRANIIRKDTKDLQLEVLQSVGEGDQLADIHQVRVTKIDGSTLQVYLHAFTTFSNGKISRIRILSMNIGGTEEDVDIASRH